MWVCCNDSRNEQIQKRINGKGRKSRRLNWENQEQSSLRNLKKV